MPDLSKVWIATDNARMCRADTIVGFKVVDAEGHEASLGLGDPEEAVWVVALFSELGEDYERAGETLAECPERQARAAVHGLLIALAQADRSDEPVLVVRPLWDADSGESGGVRWAVEPV